MNHYMPSTPAPSPPFAMDGTDPSLVSPTTSTSSWSMDADPQLFTPDATFWHDMSSYICASPKSSYDYRHDDASECPEDVVFGVTKRGTRKARSKEQSPEVILRRRAQNRASQRAYRDRKDRRVKELETQLEEMGEQNETLRRDHEQLCAEHQKLKEEQARWREGKEALENDDAQLWRTETCLSPVLGENAKDLMEKGLMVKVMICKRCFGNGANAHCD